MQVGWGFAAAAFAMSHIVLRMLRFSSKDKGKK
jgi:hypothetical protein